MCLVAFQKIFRKIFSGVWKRRRITQIQKNTSHNPEKNRDRRRERKIQDRDRRFARSRRRSRSREKVEIAIAPLIAIYGAVVGLDLSSLIDGAISDLPLSPSIAISIQRDLATARLRSTARSRDGEIAINGAISPSDASPLTRARSLSLSLSLIFRKCFEGKIEV